MNPEPAEVWRSCPRNPSYAVSSLGRVKRVADSKTHKATGKCLRPSLRGGRMQTAFVRVAEGEDGRVRAQGYPFVQLCADGKRENVFVHHLVAEAFIGPRPAGMNVHHIDANTLNARVENLTYVSQSENVQESYKAGNADRRGERNTQAKLTIAAAEEIRRAYRAGGVSKRALAERFGVTEGAVRAVLAGRTWRPTTPEAGA